MRVRAPRWWRRWRERRACMHHDRSPAVSWIREQLIETGMGKMFWCTRCQRTWFV